MKKILSLLLCLLLLSAVPCAALELETGTVLMLSPVVDLADLLTDEETNKLADMTNQIHQEHGIFVAVVTVNSLDGKTAESYADDFYDNGYYQHHPDGVLLLIAMDTREWAISTCGEAIWQLSDWELDQLFYAMSDDLADNDFYPAFVTFLDELPQYLSADTAPEPGMGDYIRIVLVSLAIGAAAGGITILIMRGQMNTAKAQSNAGNYLISGSFQIKRHSDIFLYSRVSRTRKPENNGGSSHRSSGGISHGGRSGRF